MSPLTATVGIVQTRSGAEIVVVGDLVYKLHPAGTDPRALGARLRLAAASGEFLSPVSVLPEPVGLRWRSCWPRVETVAPEPDQAPWAQAGALLADLHREPVPRRGPVHGWPQRLRRAVGYLRGAPDAAAELVRAAAAGLPEAVWRAGSPGRPVKPVHGDWHLGQLGRLAPGEPWLLIDIDDAGLGDPAWDLARPAGFWAAGLIPDEDWHAFLAGYRHLGPALGAGDPWPVLEPFARAAVVHAAASGVAHGDGDDTQRALLEACQRMV